MVQKANKNGLVLAAICHGPQMLAAAGVCREFLQHVRTYF
jgi:putative intracellular protease/amidase